MKKLNLGNTRLYQSTFRPEVWTNVNSKFKCCNQTLKFGTVLSETFGSLQLRKSWILDSIIYLNLWRWPLKKRTEICKLGTYECHSAAGENIL